MSETKEYSLPELIEFLDEKTRAVSKIKNIGLGSTLYISGKKELNMLTQIKSFLEQQYQHEQNILNYGTDEPEEEQPQPDDELVEFFDGLCLFLANHGFKEVDPRAVKIRKLLKGEK